MTGDKTLSQRAVQIAKTQVDAGIWNDQIVLAFLKATSNGEVTEKMMQFFERPIQAPVEQK